MTAAIRFLSMLVVRFSTLPKQSRTRLLTCGGRSSDHVTPILRNLHWLKIRNRITFKILLLVYKAAIGNAPQCLTDLMTSASTIPDRASLRSSGNRTLPVLRSRIVRHGYRSFHVRHGIEYSIQHPFDTINRTIQIQTKNLFISWGLQIYLHYKLILFYFVYFASIFTYFMFYYYSGCDSD